MKTIIEILKNTFSLAIEKAYPSLLNKEEIIEVMQSTQDKFGHYQCNSPMKLVKFVKEKPRVIAQMILDNLELNDSTMIEKLEIAGPGFINITLSTHYISEVVMKMGSSEHFGIAPLKKQERIIIDFSSPNTAKEMHVGHLRSTIIGDCLARLFEFLNYDVVRLNHIGDWGTAFGMLIAYIKAYAPEVIKGNEITDLPHLVKFYKAAKEKFDRDSDFKTASQLEVVALQRGDPINIKAWNIICDISRKAYQEIYDLLDIQIVERGESFYNPMLKSVVADLESKGLVTLSNGAKCIFLEGFMSREGSSLPLMIQKSDGGYNYDTTDMATIRYRIEEEKGDRLIYVTDAGQNLHFQMIFAAAIKAGYLDPLKVRVDHVPFGLVLGGDGKKFRTRSGDTERLIDLLFAAIEQAEHILKEKSPHMEIEERKKLAKALGIGAVKYADLSCHRVGDYHFSYERMLRFEGNTAAFLMYAYVRVVGIKRKIKDSQEILSSEQKIVLEHPSEISLGIHLTQFSEALNLVAEELLPNRLTDYLYLLADKFNAFFRDCRVEGSAEQNSRLFLCEVTARILKQGLEILGVPLVEKM